MSIDLDLQLAGEWPGLPADEDFERWVAAALQSRDAAELTVRVVGREESRELNQRYRGKHGPTNVLSFPSDLPAELELPLLGDIVICAPVIRREALQYKVSYTTTIARGWATLQAIDHEFDPDVRSLQELHGTGLTRT